ncbi:MAG: sigma-70 family RNA polymerase sigma factor [Planctomycetes bacterium]|jgi:RNA polymerase sigma-70 factor (ECF subfamily)|nr:sigma-70 family RNA polymerase sigma factor [Planctomycetota bacterium]
MEDKWLILRLRAGSTEALCRIYEKYESVMLTVAAGLLNDVNGAQDAVHDVFVTLAQSPGRLRLAGSLRSFLTTCVANLARDRLRARRHQSAGPLPAELPTEEQAVPLGRAIQDESLQRLADALVTLPDEQREVIVLHLQGDLTFREIARVQGASINTVQSRYRYGIDKLRSLLNGEVEP